MKLYEIALPVADNAGNDTTEATLQWEAFALLTVGGFTRLPVADGAWKDPADGRVYRDKMQGYRVMANAAQFADIVQQAFSLFSDQVAIFVAEIGNASAISRDDWAKFFLPHLERMKQLNGGNNVVRGG